MQILTSLDFIEWPALHLSLDGSFKSCAVEAVKIHLQVEHAFPAFSV
jgi:hypothetical protein